MKTWKENSLLLAEKLVKHIAQSSDGVSIDALDVRARAHGIDVRLLDRALEHLHKGKKIQQTVKKGTLYYMVKVEKKKSPMSHLTWVRENYPEDEISEKGKPIPFYDPETDGPTPHFSKETDIFLRKKNEELKRKAAKPYAPQKMYQKSL